MEQSGSLDHKWGNLAASEIIVALIISEIPVCASEYPEQAYPGPAGDSGWRTRIGADDGSIESSQRCQWLTRWFYLWVGQILSGLNTAGATRGWPHWQQFNSADEWACATRSAVSGGFQDGAEGIYASWVCGNWSRFAHNKCCDGYGNGWRAERSEHWKYGANSRRKKYLQNECWPRESILVGWPNQSRG